MSLISDVPLSNVTVYRKDYNKKEIPRREPYVPERDYEDPIAGPFQEYLLPYRFYNSLSKPTDYPEPREYVKQLLEIRPTARRYLKDPPLGPPDFEIIDRLYDNDNRSMYMVDYCHLGDFDSKSTRIRSKRFLPEGWIVPLTSQQCGYRDPRLLAPEGIPALKLTKRKDNLAPNEKLREILGVTTGESDYMATIGKTGQDIIDGKLHGDVNMRPQFSEDELLRAMLIRKD